MFGTFALTALLASTSILIARADVVPTVPGPNTVYNTGAKCHIEWEGDKDSSTAWKNMSIELMTGNNFEMIYLTTVATNQDGTIPGTFDHPCPAVTPNSAIYFYQFSAPGASTKQWATRFTIASSTGESVPPENALQPPNPNGGEPAKAIPWGIGALAGSSTPSFGANTTTTSLPTANSSTSTSTSSSSSTSSTSTIVSSRTNSSPTVSRFQTVISSSIPTPIPSDKGTAGAGVKTGANNNSAAVASVVMDSRGWKAAITLCASAMAFTLFL